MRELPSHIGSEADYAEDLHRWRAERSIENAFDIFSVGLQIGERKLIWEGGLQIISDPSQVAESVADAVRREIAPSPELGDLRRVSARLESNEQYLRSTIRLLKKRLLDAPRDAISAVEIARVYTILGQYVKAEKWLHTAYYLAPNARQVLRAIVQFYDVQGDVSASLHFVRKAETLNFDPLIQSAEIAASNISGKASKVASRAKNKLRGVRTVDRAHSELALSIATLERDAGVSERKVFQFVSAGLHNPSENAAAQAVWLGEQSSRGIKARYPNLIFSEDAFEARAYILFDNRHYEMALQSALDWFRDQPFQAHPLAFICTCAAVYCDRATESLRYADLIRRNHADDFNAVNAALLVYAEAGLATHASSIVRVMEGLAKSDADRAFLAAAKGMIEFRFGDLSRGRAHYVDAMRHARTAKRHDLVFTAATFYVLGEAKRRNVTPKELGVAIDTLDRLVSKVPVVNRAEAERVWDRAKQVIARDYKAPDDDELGSGLSEVISDVPTLMEA